VKRREQRLRGRKALELDDKLATRLRDAFALYGPVLDDVLLLREQLTGRQSGKGLKAIHEGGLSLIQALESNAPLTVKQAADYLQISERTLHRYMQSEDLPFFKMARELRFYRADLDRWLRRRGEEGRSAGK
jgi:excisionase family DNA binding protein